MRISGTLENQSGAAFTAEDDSLINVAGGELQNRGELTLESGSSSLTLLSGGSLRNDGGTLRLNAGTRLLVADDAGSLQQLSGDLFVANTARIEIGPTRNLEVFGGRVSNEGVIVAVLEHASPTAAVSSCRRDRGLSSMAVPFSTEGLVSCMSRPALRSSAADC